MPDQTSRDELRKEILTEFKQVLKLAPADYTENCTNVVMSLFDQNRHKNHIRIHPNDLQALKLLK